MKTYEIFIANAPEGIAEAQIHEMFAGWGDVKSVRPFVDSRGAQVAGKIFLSLETECALPDVMEALNGYQLGEHRLAVTPCSFPPSARKRSLSKEEEALCSHIISTFDEKEGFAQRSIARIVRFCGVKFAQTVFEDALVVEEAGGLMVPDGSRRRTPGGVFFFLVRTRVSPRIYEELFLRHRQAKKRKKERAQSTSEPVSASPAQVASKSEPKPASPPDPLAGVRAQLAALRASHHAAQQNLEALQTGKKRGGLLTTMKQVVDLQRQIDALLEKYPGLNQ